VLAFNINNNGNNSPREELEILLDAAGLQTLVARLQMLADGKTDHIHLMSAEWGDGDIEAKGDNAIHHVKLLLQK